jgi:hypothetical protein
MLTLTAGAKAVFDTRQATIIPILTVYNEAGVGTVIDPVNIIKRPKRQSFPIGAYGISASPVMRCDLSLAPTATIRALFLEQRRVVYQEIINGQTFPKFDGKIDKIDKGWMVDPSSGALADTLSVFCFSYTQGLKVYDDEVFTTAQTTPYGDLSLTPIIRANVRTWIIKATGATSAETMPGTAAGGSNNIIDANDPAWTIAGWFSASNVLTTATAGTDFTITIPSGNITITWLGTGNQPPANQEYYLQYKTVLGFVAEQITKTITGATNASPISITSTAHGFSTGDVVAIYGVTGNTAANASWTITKIDANTYTLNGSVGSGAYISGGKATKPITYTDPVTPSVFSYVHYYQSDLTGIEKAVEGVDPVSDLAFIRAYAVYQCSPAIYTRAGTGTGTSTRAKDTDWNFNPSTGIAKYIGPGKLFSSSTAPLGYEVLFVGLKSCKIVDITYAANDLGRRVSDLYYRAGIMNNGARFALSGVTATDISARASGDTVLANLIASSPPNYIVRDDTDGLPRAAYVTQKANPDFTLSTITALKNQEPQTIATRYYCYNTVPVVLGIGADTGTMDHANCTMDGQSSTYATIKAGNTYGLVFVPNTPTQRLKSIKVRFEGELTIVAANDAHTPAVGIPIPGNLARMGYQTSQVADVVIQNTDGSSCFTNFPMRPGSNRVVNLVLGPLATVATPKLYTVEATYDYDYYGQAFLTNDATRPAGWADAGNGDITTLVKYTDPNQVKRWMPIPSVVAASTTADPFYANYWGHKTIKVEQKGVTNPRTLRTIASQYLDDALKHSTTQKATVVMEPLAEIGDTVQVNDLDLGTTYNRTIVGFEDSDDWDNPAITFDLADFS